MNIEYHESGSADCPLIRIYGTSIPEFLQLHAAAEKLADGSINAITFEDLPNFHVANDCSLTLTVSTHNEGVVKLAKKQWEGFEFRLPRGKWAVVAGLIEPFTTSPLGSYHQWLCGKEAIGDLRKSKIAIVISSHKDGAW